MALSAPPGLPEQAVPTGAAWAFFGRCPAAASAAAAPLLGKAEHVDELRPGVLTVHAQLCGRKTWRLRPNLAAPWGSGAEAAPRVLGKLANGHPKTPAGRSFTGLDPTTRGAALYPRLRLWILTQPYLYQHFAK